MEEKKMNKTLGLTSQGYNTVRKVAQLNITSYNFIKTLLK